MVQRSLLSPLALSVTEISRYLKQLLEADEILQDVWVQGEISNLARPVSGHIYFTLKDASASLRCVIWKTSASRLRVALQNGLSVEAHGNIGVYEQGGNYQLYVDALRLGGEGALYQEFLRLKARLEGEGLFAPERKRPLPSRPKRIGLVTSATGAALQDMLNTLTGRYPLVEVVLAPCAVQGEDAPPEIIRSLRALNRLGRVDVIIVGRGGGSLEDLWAFNDERVVRAIAGSEVPVITGIGHETDFTLADFAADLRAPTPTGAAVLASPDAADLILEIRQLASRLGVSIQSRLDEGHHRLEAASDRLRRASPMWQIQNDRQRVDQAGLRLERSFRHALSLRQTQLTAQSDRLRALNPFSILQRGYAMVHTADGSLVRSASVVNPSEEIRIRMSDGEIDAQVQSVVVFKDRSNP